MLLLDSETPPPREDVEKAYDDLMSSFAEEVGVAARSG
jgi:hypothetical protein